MRKRMGSDAVVTATHVHRQLFGRVRGHAALAPTEQRAAGPALPDLMAGDMAEQTGRRRQSARGLQRAARRARKSGPAVHRTVQYLSARARAISTPPLAGPRRGGHGRLRVLGAGRRRGLAQRRGEVRLQLLELAHEVALR